MATSTKKAPAKKVRITKKQVTAHRTRTSRDMSPAWDGAQEWSSEQFTRQFRNAMEYYRLESSVKDLRPKVAEWMEQNGYAKSTINEFRKLKDRRIPSTLCGIAACLVRGMPEVHEGFNNGKDTAAWLRNAIEEAIKQGANDIDDEDEAEAKPVVKKETIQDRLAEKATEAMGEIEGIIDDYLLTGKESSAASILTASNVAAQHVNKVVDMLQPRINELNEYLEGKDAQLMEAYNFLGKRGAKNLIKFYEKLINDTMAYKAGKMAARAKPKRRPVPPERQVKGLKFLKDFAELGLKSINPTEILGATELWVYNTKTRKLGRFVVPTHGEMTVGSLGVKGSAITGYDELRSTMKTLRKPAEKLAEWAKCGKPQLRKFMDGIKGVELKMKGRISPDTVLLRAIK